MNVPRSSCPHITIIGDYTKDDIIMKQVAPCDTCDVSGPNLWVCLHRNCLSVGCSDVASNHSIRHFQRQNDHCLILNLTSLQVYCLLCKCEVFLENNDPPIPGMLPPPNSTAAQSDSDSEDELDLRTDAVKPRGLTGLQNMGNTCYMNSALQSLSNCPQLTNFFLECGAFVKLDKKPGLAKSYMFLIKEMWHKKRPSYVVPSGIAFGIKLVFPVFRGYSQQDAQEFLRCFMDQLHEELKEPVVELNNISSLSPVCHDEFDGVRSDSGIPVSEESSQSDGDYETCDSGPNSEKDSCADEAIDHSDPSQESSDILIPTSEQNKEHDCYISHSAIDSALPSHSDTYLNLECGDNSSEQLTMHQMPPDCYSRISNPDSALATDASISCDKSDCPLLKGECKSCYDGNLGIVDEVIRLDSQSGNCLCKHSSSISASHICNTDAYSLQQASQLKHIASQAIINSMLTAQKKKPVQYRSIISDIFDGKILSSVQCLTCDTLSFTKETFQDLSLPIPTRDHLHMIHAAQGSQQKSGGTCTDVYSHRGWFSSLFNWMLRPFRFLLFFPPKISKCLQSNNPAIKTEKDVSKKKLSRNTQSWFIGPSVTLQDCLAAFFSADELKGDNMYSCEKCKKLRNGIKYSKVVELPEVLCIHLKRFRHEVMYSTKISSHVTFPLEGLDMSQFLHKSYGLGVSTYDLASVICHHGTAGSGHYTAYSINYLNDQWYEFDDQYVTAVDAELVRNCEAYVLFYRKSGEEIIRKRQCAVELLDRSRNENGLLKFFISKQWINKFNNFAEPGPITNTDFLCIHGGVPPQKASYASDLCTSLPQAVWEYLHDTFGGGPSCTHLYICPICQAELDRLKLKKKKELEDFVMMNSEFQHRENPSVVYALSLNWYKTWENFVCRDGDLPAPIDNSAICYVKNNQSVLKLGSDYCSVSKEMYRYLLNIYGGGPDIISQPNPNTISGAQSSVCRYSHLSLTNPVPSSTCNYVQNVQVHSSSRTNFSSHSQLSSSAKIPCDTETNKKVSGDAQVNDLSALEKVDITVENV